MISFVCGMNATIMEDIKATVYLVPVEWRFVRLGDCCVGFCFCLFFLMLKFFFLEMATLNGFRVAISLNARFKTWWI